MNTLFDRFWQSGIRKMDKKKAKRAFSTVIKAQEDPESFVDMLIIDVQKRLQGKQLGFDKMYPATYLNGERWDDELPACEPDAFERLQDRGWAKDLLEDGVTAVTIN